MSLLIGEERSQQHKTTDLVRVISEVVVYIAALLVWLYYRLGFNVTHLVATSAVLTVVIGAGFHRWNVDSKIWRQNLHQW